MITQERLKELFEYRDGGLFWKTRFSAINVNRRAGGVRSDGYRRVRVDGLQYQEHRVIYLMFYGELPEFLDHIDNDRCNNRIENLRPCSPTENQQNRCVNKNNTSGVKGVSWDERRGKWRAQLSFEGSRKFLGYFIDLTDAEKVITTLRELYHGSFAKHS